MQELGVRIGLFLIGWAFGLSGAVFYVIGLGHRDRLDSGQPILGKTKELDPVVNTDRTFIDDLAQDRLQKGLDPYQNEK